MSQCARGRELGLAPAAGDLGHDVGGGEVAARRAAGVEHLQHPQPVVACKLAGEGGDEILAQEARRAIAMGLVDRQHAASAEMGGLERGGDLVGVVGEIVDHRYAAGAADGLEPPPHALEARERRRHLGKRHVEGAAGGDGGERVRDIVQARHLQGEAHVVYAKAAAGHGQLHILAAHIGAGGEAEAERAAGKRVEIFGVAHHERLAGAGAQARRTSRRPRPSPCGRAAD